MGFDLNTIRKGIHRAIAPRQATPEPPQQAVVTHADRIKAEQLHFSGCQDQYQLPEIFTWWSNKYVRPKFERLGLSSPDAMFCRYFEQAYVADRFDTRYFLSLGTGNCATEVMLAKHLVDKGFVDFQIECVDLNSTLLAEGVASARERGVGDHIVVTEADANKWTPTKVYTGILANQSLHHIENLEGVLAGIELSLAPTGTFITSDMIGRNGHMRWPEALSIVHEFWRELPPEYTYNHLLKRNEPLYENWDCSLEGFEGIRAQDILPLLIKHFEFDFFIPFSNVIDPFLDRTFGPNFSPKRKWDADFIDRVHARDEAELARGSIKPTHIVAAMCNVRPGRFAPDGGLTPRFSIRWPNRAPRGLPMPLEESSASLVGDMPDAHRKLDVCILPTKPVASDLLIARIQSVGQLSLVSIKAEGRDIRIELERASQASPQPLSTELDIGLGRFPAGLLSISVVRKWAPDDPITAAVEVGANCCVVGPSTPVVDYTDMWWNPDQPGWGMSIHQHPSGRLLAAWLVYDATGTPVWYSLQPGAWIGPAAYTGTIYTFGAGVSPDLISPEQVTGEKIGTGNLVFTDFETGTFGFDIRGATGSVRIVRMRF